MWKHTLLTKDQTFYIILLDTMTPFVFVTISSQVNPPGSGELAIGQFPAMAFRPLRCRPVTMSLMAMQLCFQSRNATASRPRDLLSHRSPVSRQFWISDNGNFEAIPPFYCLGTSFPMGDSPDVATHFRPPIFCHCPKHSLWIVLPSNLLVHEAQLSNGPLERAFY